MSVLLDNILVDLRIIAKVPENGKICTTTSDPVAVESNDAYQAFRRWTRGDSRDQMYKVLKNLVDKIIDISDTLLNSSFMNLSKDKDITHHQYNEHQRHYNQLNSLATEIDHSLKGFGNVLRTYEDDATIASKLEVLISRLDGQKNKIKNCLEKSV